MTTPVSQSTGYGPNREMSILGYIVGIGIGLLLLPLLPVAIVGWLLWRLLGGRFGRSEPVAWGRRDGAEQAV
ncbi:DUF7535 family protein [Halovivax gelatinilyticus]|uniref:DUF7535 family protein n=1 Tax=Halovivax gelatinilyticus TaxID=2961597 RepID=UPI0020CA34D8|nr:hypothetical protein [Halovivax gelatinilyticus]